MSSSEFESGIPTLLQALSIPELIKFIKHSFLELEFNEVQKILMDREKKLKTEIKNLRRDCDSIKEEACLLERSHGLAELEKLKLEEKLERCGRQCEELKETIKMLTLEQRPFYDRLKREKDCNYDDHYEEKSKMESGKNESIIKLNEKINELKNQNLESEELVRSYQEKLKCMDMKLVEMEQVITDLRREKLVLIESVEELRQRQIESHEVVEELRCKNVEAAKLLDELRFEKMKSDKGSEYHEGWYLKLEGKVMEMKGMLANMLKVKLEDIADVVNTIENSAPSAQGGNVELPDCFRSGKLNGDADDVVILSPRACFATNSTGLPMKGGTNLDQSWKNRDDTIKGEEPRISDIIEIYDSDDETNTGCGELITKKRKRSEEENAAAVNDVDSTDSECSDAHIEHLLASLGAK